jgi:hypothetical protein
LERREEKKQEKKSIKRGSFQPHDGDGWAGGRLIIFSLELTYTAHPSRFARPTDPT